MDDDDGVAVAVGSADDRRAGRVGQRRHAGRRSPPTHVGTALPGRRPGLLRRGQREVWGHRSAQVLPRRCGIRRPHLGARASTRRCVASEDRSARGLRHAVAPWRRWRRRPARRGTGRRARRSWPGRPPVRAGARALLAAIGSSPGRNTVPSGFHRREQFDARHGEAVVDGRPGKPVRRQFDRRAGESVERQPPGRGEGAVARRRSRRSHRRRSGVAPRSGAGDLGEAPGCPTDRQQRLGVRRSGTPDDGDEVATETALRRQQHRLGERRRHRRVEGVAAVAQRRGAGLSGQRRGGADDPASPAARALLRHHRPTRAVRAGDARVSVIAAVRRSTGGGTSEKWVCTPSHGSPGESRRSTTVARPGPVETVSRRQPCRRSPRARRRPPAAVGGGDHDQLVDAERKPVDPRPDVAPLLVLELVEAVDDFGVGAEGDDVGGEAARGPSTCRRRRPRRPTRRSRRPPSIRSTQCPEGLASWSRKYTVYDDGEVPQSSRGTWRKVDDDDRAALQGRLPHGVGGRHQGPRGEERLVQPGVGQRRAEARALRPVGREPLPLRRPVRRLPRLHLRQHPRPRHRRQGLPPPEHVRGGALRRPPHRPADPLRRGVRHDPRTGHRPAQHERRDAVVCRAGATRRRCASTSPSPLLHSSSAWNRRCRRSTASSTRRCSTSTASPRTTPSSSTCTSRPTRSTASAATRSSSTTPTRPNFSSGRSTSSAPAPRCASRTPRRSTTRTSPPTSARTGRQDSADADLLSLGTG